METDLWREVSRHLEIEEFLDRVLPVVQRRHRWVGGLAVQRIDERTNEAWSLAAVGHGANDWRFPNRRRLTPDVLKAFHSWKNTRRPLASHAMTSLLRDVLGAIPNERAFALLPLLDDDGTVGALVLTSRPDDVPRQLRTVDLLIEPFATAVRNDARIRELERLRAAAEADRSALLTRLGRDTIAETIVGADHGLRDVMARVDQVAPGSAPVLILGETGTGKEVIARAIHERSSRAGGPMVRVNCGAIAPELLDSELFGHERGAFTGATSTRQGWFEQADGGTLLLDEVGELSLAAQVRLLRVLQDGTFQRVGGERTLHVDVRVIAATHRDLPEMVQDGSFREDLWYRLSVFPLQLPPLRERPADIGPLAEWFADRAGRRLGGAPLRLHPLDRELLERYAWPGNARELAAVIERAAILGDGRRLDVPAALGMNASPGPRGSLASARGAAYTDHSPRLARGDEADPAPRPGSATGRHHTTTTHPDHGGRDELFPRGILVPASSSLDDAVTARIEAALAECQGMIEGEDGAAAILGIHPSTLRSRMKKLGIDWRRFRRVARRA
mgnify:CR=1 FL=1